MKNKYFEFLSNLVGDHEHNMLLRELHRIEFYSIVPNDDNRGEDGRRLREIFLDGSMEPPSNNYQRRYQESHTGSSSLQNDLPLGPCTVLEMLIGVAIRMEFNLEGCPFEKTAAECFWIIINNLELDWCTDAEYLNHMANEIVREQIETLLDRKYDPNGEGGMFPLMRPSRDQREVEIWYQMSEYLLENYEF